MHTHETEYASGDKVMIDVTDMLEQILEEAESDGIDPESDLIKRILISRILTAEHDQIKLIRQSD